MTYMKAATASIDLNALEHNLNQIKSKAPQCKVMSVVKANGYGHGLLHIAKHSKNSDAFGVARIEEAYNCVLVALLNPFCCWKGFTLRVIYPSW